MLPDIKYAHVLTAFRETPWAMLPSKLEAIAELLAYRGAGLTFSREQIQERLADYPHAYQAAAGQAQRNGAIAVLPLFGVVSQRMNMMSDISGGTSTERYGQAFRQAVADPTVNSVVLQIDSPGGSVFGVDELFSLIYGARGAKPIVAQVDSMAASAAYWIATAADEIVMTPGGMAGSIGVYSMHTDVSAQSDMLGEKNTFISAGKFKTEGNMYEPLSAEARDAIQGQVDGYYAMFTKAVARGRGVSADAVRNGYGQGRVVGADQAKAMGMVDRIGTMDQTLARLANPNGRAKVGQRAEAMNIGQWAPSAGYQPMPYHEDADELVVCPECQKHNADDATYCDQCGFDLTSTGFQPSPYQPEKTETVTCPHCQRMNDDDASYCDQCGFQLLGADGVTVDAAAFPQIAGPRVATEPDLITPAGGRTRFRLAARV